MSEAQIKILLENNELDFLLHLLKNAHGRAVLNPKRAQRISRLLTRLYQAKQGAEFDKLTSPN